MVRRHTVAAAAAAVSWNCIPTSGFVAPLALNSISTVLQQHPRTGARLSEHHQAVTDTNTGIRLSKSGLSSDLRWITDPWDRGVLFSVKVGSVVHDVRSKFQHVQVLDTAAMGRMLVLDNALQCAERDEAGYHEMITHVPLCREGASTDSGKRALIIGGGDGGAAREVLRHEDIGAVDLVDVDAEVMAASKKFLPGVWRHPSSTDDLHVPLDNDPRLTVRAEDGFAFLAHENRENYDLIVVDASDPVGPGAALYSDDFYALLRRRLRPKGAVAVQGGSFWYLPMVFRTVFHGLKKAFPMVRPLQCFTAVYPGGVWNLQIATLGDDPQEVDFAKAEALCIRHPLMFYDGCGHHASFSVPPVALRELEKPPPSLRDTTTDLEEIMGYGEEEDNSYPSETGVSSRRWEPDVRLSLFRADAFLGLFISFDVLKSRLKHPCHQEGVVGDQEDEGDFKQLETAEDHFVSFSKLDLPGKWSARIVIHSRKESFTGLAGTDELLRRVHLLLPYVSQLGLTWEEKSVPRKRRRAALGPNVNVRRSLSRLVSGKTSMFNSHGRGSAPLAAFDADGTLWDGDAAEVFLAWMEASNRWSHHGKFISRYYSLLNDGNKRSAYGYVAQLFNGMDVAEVSRLCDECFQANMVHLVVPEMKELVQDLRARGWRVIIVTASPKWIVEPGARWLGLTSEDVIGIEVEISGRKATSVLRYPMPVREGKAEALKMMFGEGPAFACGNSLDDGAMLSYARGLALVSNPSSLELEELAREKGWSVHHLQEEQ